MSSSLTEAQITSHWAGEGPTCCFVYTGSSMAPLFRAGDLLLVRPLALSDVRLGDVVVFRQPDEGGPVVHRAVGWAASGLVTRGDASIDNDPAPVPAEALIGHVEALERGGKRRRVAGRWAGRLLGWAIRGGRRAFMLARKILRFPYRALRGSSVVRRLLGRLLSPQIKVVRIQTPHGPLVKFIHNGRTVAHWWPQSNRFECRKPYDLIIPRPDGA